MVAFAQALAGTVLQPPVQVGDDPDRAREPAAPRAPRRARDSKPDHRPERLDTLTVATFEEAMLQPWVDQTTENPRPRPPKPQPDPPLQRAPNDPLDPWGLIVPSYAGEADK